MKKVYATISILFITTLSFGQTAFKQNDIYLEAGGNGLFGSVNYERQLAKEPGLGARVGIGVYSEKGFYLTIPVGINYLFKLNNKQAYLDAGLGATWTRADAKIFRSSTNSNGEHFTNFIPGLGYRKHTTNNVMWRVSISPVINKYGFVPWVGISIGKRF